MIDNNCMFELFKHPEKQKDEQSDEPSSPKNPNIPTQERTSGLLKIVGTLTTPEEDRVKKYYQLLFEEQPISHEPIVKNVLKFFSSIKELKDIERSKTPEETETIEQINLNMAKFVSEYGGQPIDVPEKNIHFLNPSKVDKSVFDQLGFGGFGGTEALAIHSTDRQSILLGSSPQINIPLKKALTIVHEMLHFNSFQSVTIKKIGPEKLEADTRRCGLEMRSPKNKSVYFMDFNEALTEELAIRFEKKYFPKIPTLQREFEGKSKAVKAFQPIFQQENSGDELPPIAFIDKEGFFCSYTYSEARNRFWKIINGILETHPDKFKSEEEIFDKFARAYFTGHFLEIARLIKDAYGRAGLRQIAEDDFFKHFKKFNTDVE